MDTWEQVLKDLWANVVDKRTFELQLDTYRNTGQSKAQEEANRDEIEQRIQTRERRIEALLTKMQRFPPHHGKHFARLEEFWKDGSYEESVFVMTKYPDGAAAKDQQLLAVIEIVKETVRKCGFKPRLAIDKTYHPQLWDNIELHLVGCARGLAIVENKHTDETNPNVSMEWGWMRGLGREVLYLIDKDFKHPRADFAGFISQPFEFENPKATLPGPIAAWLK
jgi:hypothetical protein